jgi:hypothetical protein
MVAMLIGYEQKGSLIRLHMPVAAGVALGALAGAACSWAGRDRRARDSLNA